MIKEITEPQYELSCDMCKKSAIVNGYGEAHAEQRSHFIPLMLTIPDTETTVQHPYVSVKVDLCRDCWNEFARVFLDKLQTKLMNKT